MSSAQASLPVPRRRVPRPPVATLIALVTVAAAIAGCQHGPASSPNPAQQGSGSRSSPIRQNYVDYTHQTAEGFAFDASEQFIEQMRWIAERGRARGGDIAFVAAVGDVWQHQSQATEPGHVARGLGRLEKSFFGDHFAPTDRSSRSRSRARPRATA